MIPTVITYCTANDGVDRSPSASATLYKFDVRVGCNRVRHRVT